MSLVLFQRFSDMFPPERELLAVEEDGAFTLWRSFGADSIGRFGGTLPSGADLVRLAAAVKETTPPPSADLEPDASVEVINVGGVEVEVEAGLSPEGPWGELATACRPLLDQLTSAPLAAIQGDVGSGRSLTLRHVGGLPLTIGTASLTVEAVRWLDGVEVASSVTRHDGDERIDAGPGWFLELPINPDVLGKARSGI